MRLLGLDVGDKRIGIALSDESATLASGLSTLQRIGPRKDLKAIAALVREHAAWALGRLGDRAWLAARRAGERDPSVAAEIDQSIASLPPASR